MLGLSWTEMMVIGLAALIFIGPKDLPVVMNRVGKIIGQIRRMGNEFQREINKTTGLDEVRNLRNSITAPLKKTSDEIRREFNAMTPTGPKPSGVLKPADPKAESVVDEIRAAAGITPPKTADQVAAEAGFKPTQPAVAASKAEAPVKVAAPKKAAATKAPARAKAVPVSKVETAELVALDAAPEPKSAVSKAPAKKPAAPKKAVKPAGAAEPKPAPKKRAPAKPKATEAAKAGDE